MRNGKSFDSVLGASLRLDLATGGSSRLIKLLDTQTGEEAKSIKKRTDWITSISYSPDGVLLAKLDQEAKALHSRYHELLK
jgi:WD40 repeat protein